MRNLNRITNHFNNIAASEDWAMEASRAQAAGYDDKVEELRPPPTASWRATDKATMALRKWLAEQETNQPAGSASRQRIDDEYPPQT